MHQNTVRVALLIFRSILEERPHPVVVFDPGTAFFLGLMMIEPIEDVPIDDLDRIGGFSCMRSERDE
jgi:hypothetical protein